LRHVNQSRRLERASHVVNLRPRLGRLPERRKSFRAQSVDDLLMRLIISDHERAALAEVTQFPLFAAITGRRSRRFPVGARIPAGALAYTSRRPVQPLSEVERALALGTQAGRCFSLR
jgi:hypothetical protein